MDIDHHENEQDLRALEHRLAAWRPSAGALDRDRMLYDAGQSAASQQGRIRAWRLATAALVLMAVGLGVLLVHERSQRMALEIDSAARALPSQPSPAPLVEVDIPPIERPAPSSYFALTARLTANPGDASWPDAEIEREPHRMDSPPPEMRPQPVPLRPRDLQRALDL
jgi:hypothetical protein